MVIIHSVLGITNGKRVCVWILVTLGLTVVNECDVLSGVLHDNTDIEFVGHIIIRDAYDTVTDHEIVRINGVCVTIDQNVSENFEI